MLDEKQLIRYINIKLAALGLPIYGSPDDSDFLKVATPLLKNHQEKNRRLLDSPCPSDQRIESFLNAYLASVLEKPVYLPRNTFTLDQAGMGRALSLPPDKDIFTSSIVTSYRVKQGVLHNPKNDRRTTQGSFHIAEGGFPVPDDKIAVPLQTYAALLQAALVPPADTLDIPFTCTQERRASSWVSLLLRPTVCPAAGQLITKKSMEIRFFAPGSLVSNLDFVETIFGNGGDPFLPENDAALDIDHWTGHTGCVILAPHLTRLTKKAVGLPNLKEATERQKRDGQCWSNEDELYNEGGAFKITARDDRGVIVTVIADNYFGYCKKEVKTQISFSANLFGLSEEEHAGGAIAFPSYILGRQFHPEGTVPDNGQTFENALSLLGEAAAPRPEGYAVDRKFPSLIYVPENATFNVKNRSVSWEKKGQTQTMKLLADHTYIYPSGYKVRMQQQIGGSTWRLIGSTADGTLCHKPCTVSGGGKSEISKPISYAMLQGPVFVRDFHKDFDEVAAILNRDLARCYKTAPDAKRLRPILSPERSLGSVVKLFTPSDEYTDEYNQWLVALPQTIRQLVFVVKRYYKPEWGESWREHFSVDCINGYMGHELRYDEHKLVANYLRVGHEKDGSWRIFKVRSDFNPADKVQVEDDITASVVVPADTVPDVKSSLPNKSVKLVQNCEAYLFQRPDDAIIRGYDHQAESDLAQPGTFLSNWEPLTHEDATNILEDAVDFSAYTPAMKNLILDFQRDQRPAYVVSSAHPRMVDGKPSKNPRYLQKRPDHVFARETYLASVSTHLWRKQPLPTPIHYAVNAVLAGRRNNPPDRKTHVPALAVYNPIHYQEGPELFMDFISSLTGKSPSTTGFGSEGALTKGPFNALWPVVDLNNALTSFILTGYPGFTTAAGYVGPDIQVDHDISLLVPEIWCRMRPEERDPAFLITHGFLEKVNDFVHDGKTIPASLLGYRITQRFVDILLGRLFETPNAVFPEFMLRPEKQSLDIFVEGIENIAITYKRVAQHYFEDGSVEAACPPLKALLHIMATGTYEGKTVDHADIRRLFTRESVLASDWYRERLLTKQARDSHLYQRFVTTFTDQLERSPRMNTERLSFLKEQLIKAQRLLKETQEPTYVERFIGTIGADPFHRQTSAKKVPAKTLA